MSAVDARGMEYDVRFSGDWHLLLESLRSDPVDLLANQITPDWDWENWPFESRISESLRPYRTHIYMPIVRYTDRMLELLDDSYRDGFVGYCELAQASVCNMTKWCTMANIPKRWVDHFKYQPVIKPGSNAPGTV